MGRLVTVLAVLSALAVIGGAGYAVYDAQAGADALAGVATLDETFDNVTLRRAHTLVWAKAEAGAALANRDAVRTGDGARAVITYRSGLVLNVDPSSLVVITPPRADRKGRNVEEVVVEAGEVQGHLGGSSGATRIVHFLDRSGKVAATLTQAPGASRPVRYRVRLGRKGTEVAVLSGKATVKTGGKTISVSAGQAAEVTKGAAPSVVHLPAYPASDSPGVDARLDLSEVSPPSVKIAWGPVTGAATYHLEIGHGFSFHQLIVDRTLTGTDYAFRPLKTGTYYWRVSARDGTGLEGDFGYVRRFTVAALSTGTHPVKVKKAPAAPPPIPALQLSPHAKGPRLDAFVLGRGLSLQTLGKGRFVPIRGRVHLRRKDVVTAQQSAGLRLERGVVVGLETGSHLDVVGSGHTKTGRILALRLGDGAVTGDLSARAKLKTLYLESGNARVAMAGGGDAGSRVRASYQDGTLRVVAERGSAQVWADGKKVMIPAGHGLAVTDGQAPGPVVTLPSAPPLVSPRDGARYSTLDSPPAIELKWEKVDGASGYQVRISYDPQGSAVVYQGVSTGTILVDNALRPGTYFWTVRALDPRGFSSSAAKPRRMMVTKDTTAPKVTVDAPANGSTTAKASVVVSGHTEADAKVKIDGKQVAVDPSGHFQKQVKLTSGINQIVIEAVDEANNVTFKNLKVRRTGGP